MPYSIAAIEKAAYFERILLPDLKQFLSFRRAVSSSWDPGFDGWVVTDRRMNSDVVTIVGYGDKITTSGLKKTPRWLSNLAKKIHSKYPHDSIYINGKIFLA